MNIDYLRYNAASMQDYLKKKLFDSGIITDHAYPGSDASLLLNLFSWTFECLQYILNNNAANVLFSDANVYENMNRLVKILSYNPKAYRTSTAEFLLNGSFNESITCECTIPRYSYIRTTRNDSNGNSVIYSFYEDYTFMIRNGVIECYNGNPVLYNGEFIKYDFENQASGKKYEVFSMTEISPIAETPVYVDNDTIRIFTEKIGVDGNPEYREVRIVDSLIMDAQANDLVCEKRLNENQEFEFKFGDGIHGKTLDKGTHVSVIYLRSNGLDGKIGPSEIMSDKLILRITGFIQNDEFINMIFGNQEIFKMNYKMLFTKNHVPVFENNNLTLSNLGKSTDIIGYEGVNEIREYAPESFRIGNRLITASDFRTYILDKYRNRIKDVYVCNNNTYCTKFYKWLDTYDKLDINIRLDGYQYADACDFNNIYIWLQPIEQQRLIEFDNKMIIKDCNRIKSLTSTLIPCKAIKVHFIPFIKYSNFKESDINYSILSKSYIPQASILVKKQRTFISDDSIKKNIAHKIIEYFKEKTFMGAVINVSELYQNILSLGYIESIKTVSTNKTDEASSNEFINGLSFASFTSDMIDFKDFRIFSQIHTLESFQYPDFLMDEGRLTSIIKIVNENSFTLKNEEI